MKKRSLAFVVLTTVLAFSCNPCFSQEAPPAEIAGKNPLSLSAFLGGVLQTVTNCTTDSNMALTFGASADYSFNENWSSFLETKLQNRGFRGFGQSSTTEFLDFVLGAAYHPKSFFSSSREKLQLGALLMLPLGNYSGALPLAFSNNAKTDIGVYLGFQEVFPVGLSQDIHLGYQVWVARGYTGIVSGVSSAFSPVELGVALVVTYL